MSNYYTLTFNKGCHGFKLSPMFKNRIYYYHKGEYDMDMLTVPSGRWTIKYIFDTDVNITVILKELSQTHTILN